MKKMLVGFFSIALVLSLTTGAFGQVQINACEDARVGCDEIN